MEDFGIIISQFLLQFPSQCGYESYHPNSSIRNYIVQQNGYFIMFYLVRILRSRSSTF